MIYAIVVLGSYVDLSKYFLGGNFLCNDILSANDGGDLFNMHFTNADRKHTSIISLQDYQQELTTVPEIGKSLDAEDTKWVCDNFFTLNPLRVPNEQDAIGLYDMNTQVNFNVHDLLEGSEDDDEDTEVYVYFNYLLKSQRVHPDIDYLLLIDNIEGTSCNTQDQIVHLISSLKVPTTIVSNKSAHDLLEAISMPNLDIEVEKLGGVSQ